MARLIYVYDPMCSWCWGYRETWLKLQAALGDKLAIEYRVGGLAPDSDEPMPIDMQQFLQQTWLRIEQQLGTPFNHEFWHTAKPRRSTYPACRAVIVARQHEKEQEMLYAIQKAYYLNAQNPSDISTLVLLAEQIGLEKSTFIKEIESENIHSLLMAEINQARSLPIQGFPSLVIENKGNYHAIPVNYLDWESTYQQIVSHI
ncbi:MULTISPECIES: DsbA family protein [unclassified Pseudoalteromonas]|uniref:DsbA family protein n=1 Tax=Pseudoalteromonas TaxID=53246 RepID=UPI000C9253CB|nr:MULTISPECIES: DsbA family protein [unclassified Pseudoalteromonas]MAD03728.1 DsbA family protein [Pseudoalteromonas sp.]MCG9707812.1 DsbA family protein [Pseudoalteromonas sp. Isolate3]NIZ07103.1 DsbA family protein [Pseudoalteromonas sp. HF66]|tara:strand:+ start:44441 stop:45046 length:606 start_codon:yes stop_codon:yes gene_type:complete